MKMASFVLADDQGKDNQLTALTDLNFEDWLEHVFGHEARFQGPPWFFDSDAAWWDPAPQTAVEFLTRLFRSPALLTEHFSDDQIAQGLTYLLNTGAVGDNGWLYNSSVPASARKACIAATFNLFSEIFAPRCAPGLGHLSKVESTPLNTVAYMFWEMFPCVALPGDEYRLELQSEILAVMERILSLDSIVCAESALHGLGHAHANHPGQVEEIIDHYLAKKTGVSAEVVAYAKAARCGCIL